MLVNQKLSRGVPKTQCFLWKTCENDKTHQDFDLYLHHIFQWVSIHGSLSSDSSSLSVLKASAWWAIPSTAKASTAVCRLHGNEGGRCALQILRHQVPNAAPAARTMACSPRRTCGEFIASKNTFQAAIQDASARRVQKLCPTWTVGSQIDPSNQQERLSPLLSSRSKRKYHEISIRYP